MVAGRHLPGIRVGTAYPTREGGRFARMDVAVFVGIAERGPCHRPVLVESAAAFEAAFGNTAKLAFDPQGEAMLTAHLAPSVRAFFANGGEQCWVIRVAWTEPLVRSWAASGSNTDTIKHAASRQFAIPGVLGNFAVRGRGSSRMEIAELMAASAGAWSNDLQLFARKNAQPVSIIEPENHRWGLRFTSRSILAEGDLFELRELDAGIVHYARIIRREGQKFWAAWSGSFRELKQETPARTGHVRLAGRRSRVSAQFIEGAANRIVLLAEADEMTVGSWVNFVRDGESIWLRADAFEDTTATGPAWLEVAAALPTGPYLASQLSIDIRSVLGAHSDVEYGLGLTPDASNSLFALEGDDQHYAPHHRRAARRRPFFALDHQLAERLDEFRRLRAPGTAFQELAQTFVDETAPESQRPIFTFAFVPLGLGAEFGSAAKPYPQRNRRALDQSGLVPFDYRLFVDPAFAGLTTQEIDRRAIQRHDLDGENLFGIHAAYDIPGEATGDASILAAPDAIQPGWALIGDTTIFPAPEPGSFSPPAWHDHTGPCLLQTEKPLRAPDYSSFLDSSVQVLARPRLGAPRNVVTTDQFRLSFSSSDAGVEFVLEEAARHDFADAAVIYRGDGDELFLSGRAAGAHYYRLRTERDGNTSQYAAQMVIVRRSEYAALASDPTDLKLVHIAMLRLAAGSAAMVALLALPKGYRANEAREYADNLVTPGFAGAALIDREARSLSYGALFHPWIVVGGEDALIAIPPEGAVAGQMARVARERGAWFASANRDLANVVGVHPAIPPTEWQTIDAARINLILPRPAGFVTHAARSLAVEDGWNQINVRRLFIMLRKLLLNVGNTFLFEPNGPTLHRSIERTLAAHFDLLQRQGAFSGRVSADSYFIRLRTNRQNRDNGRVLAEIGIAPSRPLEFIEVSLVQQGERLTLEEAA